MPKSPKNDLFRMISSLSTMEKQHIRRFFRQRSPGKATNSEALFDELLNVEQYDERVLKEKLPPPVAGNLSYEKHRLMSLLLQALRTHLSESRVEMGVRNEVAEAAILLERGLYEAGMKRLTQARKKAFLYGMDSLVLEILDLQRFELKRTLSKSSAEELTELDRITYSILDSLREQARLRELADQVFILVRQEFGSRTDGDRERLLEIAQAHELGAFPENGTFESKKLFLLVHGQLAQYNREYRQAKEHYRDLVELWRDHPPMMATRSKDYKTSLANYLQICHLANQHDEFPEILKTIKAIPPRNFEEEAEDFQNVAMLEFLWKMNGQDPFEAAPMIPDIEKGMSRYSDRINQSRLITLKYNIAVLQFVAGEHKEALFWVRDILDMGRSNHRKDIRNFARVFEIVLHYELGNRDTLSYFFTNAYRILRRRQRLHAFEKALLNTINRLDGAVSTQVRLHIYERLHEELRELSNDPRNKNVLGFEEMKLWVRSKISGKTMVNLLHSAE